MGTWFDTYHLSRPPLVKDEFDTIDVPPLRARLADGTLVLGTFVGLLVTLVRLEAGEPLRGLALGLGVALTAAAGGQLLCYAPEARAAWSQGRRGWVSGFLMGLVAGVALLVWGLTGS